MFRRGAGCWWLCRRGQDGEGLGCQGKGGGWAAFGVCLRGRDMTGFEGDGHVWEGGGCAEYGVPASASEGPQYLIPVCKQLVWGRARPADGGLSR